MDSVRFGRELVDAPAASEVEGSSGGVDGNDLAKANSLLATEGRLVTAKGPGAGPDDSLAEASWQSTLVGLPWCC